MGMIVFGIVVMMYGFGKKINSISLENDIYVLTGYAKSFIDEAN